MATLSPTAWIEAVTTAPPSTLNTSNSHTYKYGRNTISFGIEVKDLTTDTATTNDIEVELWGYKSSTDLPTWIGNAIVSFDTGPGSFEFLLNTSYPYIYVRQSEQFASQGTTTGDLNPPYEYRVILDTIPTGS